MFKKAILCIAVLGLLFAGCKHPTVYKEVQAPGMFTMQLPAYMRATNELFRGGNACMQYENDSAQLFLLVFDTTRKAFTVNTLKAFYDSIVANPAIKDPHISLPKYGMLNHDSCISSEMTGISEGIKTVYEIEVVATVPRFYYVLLWTRDDKKQAMKEDLDKIMGSFEEIKE